MSIEEMIKAIGEIKEKADVRAVFGEPQVVGERTVIPVGQVWYGFGMGFGQGPAPGGEGAGEGGGGGGGARVRPLAVLEITPSETRVIPIVDSTRIVLYGIVTGAWSIFLISRTVKALARRRSERAEKGGD